VFTTTTVVRQVVRTFLTMFTCLVYACYFIMLIYNQGGSEGYRICQWFAIYKKASKEEN